MPLPPLYKFMDVRGAKLTFDNNTFRHAKPSSFNDVEDMTVQSLFPDELEVAWQKIAATFGAVLLDHLDDAPTCASPMKEQIELLQEIIRQHPDMAELLNPDVADIDIEKIRQNSEDFLELVNQHFQNYRVFCVTTAIDSERLWDEYADHYSGVALRIEPNMAKDSKFQLFEPVVYAEQRPPLYSDTLTFAADSLFGDHDACGKAMARKIIYAKTLAWEHEFEYRLAIALGEDEEPYDTLLFHPEEAAELYLGERMRLSDIGAVVAKARRLNPAISIFQCERNEANRLRFRKL